MSGGVFCRPLDALVRLRRRKGQRKNCLTLVNRYILRSPRRTTTRCSFHFWHLFSTKKKVSFEGQKRRRKLNTSKPQKRRGKVSSLRFGLCRRVRRDRIADVVVGERQSRTLRVLPCGCGCRSRRACVRSVAARDASTAPQQGRRITAIMFSEDSEHN